MDFKESLIFVIFLLSPFDLAESAAGCYKNTQECQTTRTKRNVADPVLGKNETEETRLAADYGYGECDGPSTWPQEFPTCGGHQQSPININLARSIHANSRYNLIMKNYDEKPDTMTLKNIGKTIVIEAEWSNGRRPTIKGGTLKGKYIFQELHFHWGATIYEPSEHLINGYSFPLELHLVHYKKKYGSLDNAKQFDDGIAVIGYVFEPGSEDNPLIKKITDKIPNVLNPSDTINFAPFKINKLAPRFHKDFATYKGSLTVPPCSEVVTWIIYLKPLTLSCTQVNGFRQIKDSNGNPVVRNFRPIQKLNGRKVFFVSKHYFY